MDTFTLADLKNFEIDISFESLIVSVIVSVICAYIIKLIYLRFAKTINNKENFSDIFVLLALTTTIVITVVKFSLALSLGLVGALSIVRFRAAIKEPEELVYLFLIIGIGLAAGSNQYQVALTLTVVAFLIIYFENKFRKKKYSYNAEILNIEIQNKDFDKYNDIIKKLIQSEKIEIELKNLNKQDDKIYITYLIRNVYKADDLTKFISNLKKIELKDFNFSFSKDVSLPL
tara:strand:+ start:1346 stop:2038 length:693 start_codon:yes stop_codon:yes gene_type:complete